MRTNFFILLLLIFPYLGISQQITGVAPNVGEQGEIITLTITGSETHFTHPEGVQVFLNQPTVTSIYPNEYTAVSDEILIVEFIFYNYEETGLYNLHLSNWVDGSMEMENAFELLPNSNPPIIESITPETAEIGELITFEISCSNTHFSYGYPNVWLSQGSYTASYANINFYNDTQLTIQIPVQQNFEPGYCDLNGYNYFDGEITLENAVLLTEDPTPPSLVSVTPNEGLQGEEITLTITGQNTHFDESYTVVWLQQGSETTTYDYWITNYGSDTLEANLTLYQSNPPGFYDVVVDSYIDGQLVLPNAFEVIDAPDPEIVSIDPQEEFQDEVIYFSVTGANTSFEQATGTTVWFNQGSSTVYCENVTAINDEMLTFSYEFHPELHSAGLYDLNIYNYLDGLLSLDNGFLLKHKTYYHEDICEGEEFEIGGNTYTESGTYEIISEDQNGFDSLLVFTLDVHPNPVVDLGNDTTIHSSITLDAGDGPYIYEWSNGETSQTIVVDTTWGYDIHEIFVTVTDANYYCNSMDDIEVTITDTTGINPEDQYGDIAIYPNPSNGQLHIDFSEHNGETVISVFDLKGRKVQSMNKSILPNSTETIDVNEINNGVYIVQINSVGFIHREMIVILK